VRGQARKWRAASASRAVVARVRRRGVGEGLAGVWGWGRWWWRTLAMRRLAEKRGMPKRAARARRRVREV